MKNIKLLLIFLIIYTLIISNMNFAKKNSTQLNSKIGFEIIFPNGGETLLIGQKYTIKFKVINVNKPYLVRLLKNGKFLGNIAKKNNKGINKVSIPFYCGKPLLGGQQYANGNNYQIELINKNHKIKVRSKGFFKIRSKISRSSKRKLPVVKINKLKIVEQPTLIKKPDLIITRVYSDNYKAKITIQNIGTRKSNPCTLELQLGCSGAPFIKREYSIPNLNPKDPNGPDLASVFFVNIELTTAIYNFKTGTTILKVDSKNTNIESKESNNTYSKDNCIK